MKRYIIILAALLGMNVAAMAQEAAQVKVEKLNMVRSGEYVIVDMDLDLQAMDVASNRAVLITPSIVKGDKSLDLTPIGVYGRDRYFHYKRNGDSSLSNNDKEMSYRTKDLPEMMEYHVVVPFEKWMRGSQLVLNCSTYGCCRELEGENDQTLVDGFLPAIPRPEIFVPATIYVRPEAEGVKTRSLSGSAYVDFVVNKTNIDPAYRNNAKELGKITATIDSVKNDSDITITSISIKGFASPDGSYAGNERLAKGRTESLKRYVQKLYHFDSSFIKTDYEPEDWAGLERYVEASSLAAKSAILEIINNEALTADAREWKIKKEYAEDYKALKEDCYPALRHSDYKVEYVIRDFTDLKQIEQIMAKNPRKLSLNEFYLLAQSYEAGSQKLNELYEVAVKVYPDDAVANLNAANAAMQKGDKAAAEKHLAKAGDSAEADYARGVLAAMQDDVVKAEAYMQKAQAAGLVQAGAALNGLGAYKQAMKEYNAYNE